ncbi:MAG: hypothetical protein ACD_45C00050G0001 [uncultured bacterium]|nr:MAG: hypothetical protein ACD_45C00050G0001 [uncultured bacterium]
MRTKLYWVGSLVLLVVILLAMVPWIDGFLFKQRYLNFLAALESMKRVQIKVLEYHQGWLSSDAKIILSAVAVTTSDITQDLPDVVLDQHISHGPFVYDSQANRWVVAWASIHNTVHLPPAAEAMLGQANRVGVAEVNTLATFSEEYINYIKTPVFNVSVPSLGNAAWQGLSGYIYFRINGQQITQIKSEINLGVISANTAVGSLSTQKISMQNEMKPEPIGLWTGESHFTVPEITVTYQNGTFSLKNVHFSNTFGVVGKNFYNNKLQFSLGEFTAPNFSITQSAMTLSVENLSVQGLLNAIQTAYTIHNQHAQPLTAQQYQQYIVPLVPMLITPTTAIKEDLTMNTSYGRMLVNGQVLWPEAVKTFDDVVKNAQAKWDVRMSASLVNQLIVVASTYHADKPIMADSEDDITQSPEQRLLNQIDAWSNQNKLDLSIGIRLKDIVRLHLAVEDFSKNVDRFVQSKEISPDIAAEIKAQYAAARNAQVQQAALPSLSPTDLAKQQWAQWVQQGYIRQDKDDYVTSITYERGVLKANGVEIPTVLPFPTTNIEQVPTTSVGTDPNLN